MNARSQFLDEWFQRNDFVIQKAQDNHLLDILQNNQKLRTLSHDNLDKILVQAALNMKELNTLVVDSLECLSEGKKLFFSFS